MCAYEAFGHFMDSTVSALAEFKINLTIRIEIARYLIEIYVSWKLEKYSLY